MGTSPQMTQCLSDNVTSSRAYFRRLFLLQLITVLCFKVRICFKIRLIFRLRQHNIYIFKRSVSLLLLYFGSIFSRLRVDTDSANEKSQDSQPSFTCAYPAAGPRDWEPDVNTDSRLYQPRELHNGYTRAPNIACGLAVVSLYVLRATGLTKM